MLYSFIKPFLIQLSMRAERHVDFEKKIIKSESKLFLKRCLDKPFQMGTVAPITQRLACVAAQFIPTHGYVVELGAGTGRLTRALLKNGVAPQNLWAVELDGNLCDFLQETLSTLPECKNHVPHVIQGDAANLHDILPDFIHGKVSAVISTVPFMCLDETTREKIVRSSFHMLTPSTPLFHITYNPKSPMAFMPGLHQQRVASLWLNLPPAFVWRYELKNIL
jgi:phosphatidylethanolamine/phosphatidyl-N-methylethanolamine N-methyltransferase